MRKLIVISLLSASLSHAGVVKFAAKSTYKTAKFAAKAAKKPLKFAGKVLF